MPKLSVNDAAAKCGVDPRTVRRWISEGRLRATRVGPRLIKVDSEDLAAVMRPVGGGAR